MRVGVITLLTPFLAWGSVAAQEDGYSLADLLECRVGQAEYGMMASAIAADVNAAQDYGLTSVESPNSLLQEFATSEPVPAFGLETSRIAFASSGILGLFDGADVHQLASENGVVVTTDSGEKYLGEKLISETIEDDEAVGMRFKTRIALNVSTVDTHPGVVLAGCTYSVTSEDLP